MLTKMRIHLLMTIMVIAVACFSLSCDQMTQLSEHQVVFEDNAYLRGTTSAEGYFNLNDYPEWVDNKDRIEEITDIIIEYNITRNGSLTDLTASFYFGENFPNVYLGSAFIAQGQTTSGLVVLPLENSKFQLVDLIMTNDAFWYSIQGNSEDADVDFEPVRVTVQGTFDIS